MPASRRPWRGAPWDVTGWVRVYPGGFAYWITSSAVASSVWGMVRPSAFSWARFSLWSRSMSGIGASINRFSVSAGDDEGEMFKGNQLLRIEASDRSA
jgi:hypothetical protein